MKKIVLAVFIFLVSINKVYTYDGGHDSLLFDGDNRSIFDNVAFYNNCFIEVIGVRGSVKGSVLRCHYFTDCGGEKFQECVVEDDQILKKGDTLVGETKYEVGSGTTLLIFMWHSGANNNFFTPALLTQGPATTIRLPDINSYCKPPTEIGKLNEPLLIISGKVEYETKGETGPKIETKGKNATVKHTKTKYTHEVKIDGNDTIDVIQVYEGSVEVTYMKTDEYDDQVIGDKIEKLYRDFQEGKLSGEELQAKMSEFQTFGQNLSDLMKPVTVDEGSKCTVTKKSINVEPIGPGDDHWWEQK